MTDEYDEGEWDFDTYFEDLWEASVEPPEFVIDGLLPVGITFMVAPPKTYKSTIEMAMTLAVAGEPCDALPKEMMQVPETGIVIGASAEATPGELRYMVEQGMGAKEGTLGRIRLLKDPWAWRLDDPNAAPRLIRKLEEVRPKLFWVDPLRDFHTLDEVDAGDMNRLLRPLQQWAKRNKAAFLVVHHTRKRSSNDEGERNLTADDARGTSAMFGLADGLITLTPKGNARVHFNVVLKRGMPWEKTVQLKVWGNGEAVALIDGNAKAVFEAMLGAEKHLKRMLTQAELTDICKMSQSTVSRALSQLRSLGAVEGMVADPTKLPLVRASVKKMETK